MKDLIILAGAPGSGKTTVALKLKERLDPTPYIDFGWLREWHLLSDWSNQSQKEEEMAFENLVCVLRNYLKNGYRNIILTDLKDEKVLKLADEFKDRDLGVFTLLVNDKDELIRRVSGERDSGFKNAEKALEYQRGHLSREKLPNEYRIDNSHNNPEKTVEQILELIK
ncbi:AAA family ATPase [Candidatus Kaiserbacteria bacterium]|nr:AAA family ATPase [Candidatus Kaiserbacteria bacterium]